MRTTLEGNRLVVFPEGRISSDNAAAFDAELRQAFSGYAGNAVIDAGDLAYISSAGLRVLLAMARERKSKLTVRNVSPEVYEIFQITGFTEILDVQKKIRTLSIDGCQVIGQGALGTVYRIDDETIVKVYRDPENLPIIRTEQEMARKAFVKGLPTAIPYDIVQTGEGYGSVFELLHAQNMNDVFRTHPELEDELLRKYVQLIRQIHSVEALPGELPSARETFLGYIDDLKDTLPADMAERLRQLLRQMPQDLHIVHGDLQMKNVMMNGDELILIDMETLCTGNPVFDLQSLYVAYLAFLEDDPHDSEHFLGIPGEACHRIWSQVLNSYFEGLSSERVREMEDRIRILAYVRFLDRVVTHGMTPPELKEIRVRHSLEHLRELLARTDGLTV